MQRPHPPRLGDGLTFKDYLHILCREDLALRLIRSPGPHLGLLGAFPSEIETLCETSERRGPPAKRAEPSHPQGRREVKVGPYKEPTLASLEPGGVTKTVP